MDKESIITIIQNIVKDITNKSISPNENLLDNKYGIKVIDILQILVTIEQEFNIELKNILLTKEYDVMSIFAIANIVSMRYE